MYTYCTGFTYLQKCIARPFYLVIPKDKFHRIAMCRDCIFSCAQYLRRDSSKNVHIDGYVEYLFPFLDRCPEGIRKAVDNL